MTTTKPNLAIERDPDIASYVCPICFGDNMDVHIETWARLNQTEDGVETDVMDAQFGDHEWDNKSRMQCRDCGHCDESGKFDANTKKRSASLVTALHLRREIIETLGGKFRVLETAGDTESWDGWEYDSLSDAKEEEYIILRGFSRDMVTFTDTEDNND